MRTSILTVVAGLGQSLVAGSAATAAFVGISMQGFFPGNPQLVGASLYAQFTKPDDRLLAVCGTADFPLNLKATQYTPTPPTFYQNPFGSDLPPPQVLVNVFPSLAYDSFVSIGVKFATGPIDTILTPGWPGFAPSSLSMSSEGWFVPPSSAQSVPDANGRVFLGQFSVANTLAGFSGRALVEVISDGKPILVWLNICVPGGEVFCVLEDDNPDFNLDGVVNVVDMLYLLGCWGPMSDWHDPCYGVGDGDLTIDASDLIYLLERWTPILEVPAGPDVHADLDGDGVVGELDLQIYLACHCPSGQCPPGCDIADINGDGLVDTRDLILILGNWGEPGPG